MSQRKHEVHHHEPRAGASLSPREGVERDRGRGGRSGQPASLSPREGERGIEGERGDPTESWSSISRNSTNGRILYRRVAPIRWLLRALDPIAPGLVAQIAFRLFRITQRHPVPARELEWLRGAQPVELELDGGRLSGWSWGEGPAVLLMHGWSGRASQMGALALAIAEAGCRAVALDAPGHGGSAGRLSSLPQFAATVRLAADAFGPLRAVIAHSFGAAGTGWALNQGVRAERLVFIGSPGDLNGYISGFRELFGLSRATLGRMLGILEREFGLRWQESRYATTVAADSTPMLVVHDEGDDETPYSGALTIARAWPRSRQLTTAGLGHRRILGDPRVLAEIADFVAGPEDPAIEPDRPAASERPPRTQAAAR